MAHNITISRLSGSFMRHNLGDKAVKDNTDRAAFRTAAVILVATILSLLLVAKCAAHSDGGMTYDLECCHSMDCAPVEKAESAATATASGLVPLGMTVTTKKGTVFVPPDFPRRESKDGRMHVCIRAGKLLCIYMPPAL